jgi:TonB family protein
MEGDWLKKHPPLLIKPSHVTISLNYIPPAPDVENTKSVRIVEKKQDNRKPVETYKTEALSTPIERQKFSGDSAGKDIQRVPRTEEYDILKDLSKSQAELKNQTAADPEAVKQLSETRGWDIIPVKTAVKEAAPLYKENPDPVYPVKAKKRGYEGVVILEVMVTKEGRAGKISVFQSSRYSILDDAAVSSVREWLFEPGERGGEKVDMPVKIPIRFKLEAE